MDYREITKIISNIINVKTDYETGFWVNTDGIFHCDEPMQLDYELTCHCGIGYYKDTGDWIVTPWLYTMDVPAVFKTAESARKMAFFWLNWMSYLYGDDVEEPRFEADWLSVKSNRTVVMMLFDMEAEKFRDELYKEEENTIE